MLKIFLTEDQWYAIKTKLENETMDMSTEVTLDRVKDLLADGQTEAATDLLLELAKQTHQEHFHSALLLKNRLETLQHRIIEGVISPSDERIEWARISRAIVDLVAQIDRGESPKPIEEILPPPPPVMKKRDKPMHPRLLLLVIPVLLLIGIFAVPKLIKQPPGKLDNITYTKRGGQDNAVEMITIQGSLVTGATREPVPNAILVIDDLERKIRVQSDLNGRFQFKIPRQKEGSQVTPYVIVAGEKKTMGTVLLTESTFETLHVMK